MTQKRIPAYWYLFVVRTVWSRICVEQIMEHCGKTYRLLVEQPGLLFGNINGEKNWPIYSREESVPPRREATFRQGMASEFGLGWIEIIPLVHATLQKAKLFMEWTVSAKSALIGSDCSARSSPLDPNEARDGVVSVANQLSVDGNTRSDVGSLPAIELPAIRDCSRTGDQRGASDTSPSIGSSFAGR
jgi:hypothetical protein